MRQKTIAVTVELTPNQAAALLRLCDKFAHCDASQYLYPHVSAAIREEQAYDMCHALTKIEKVLADTHARSWPWIETGSAT